MWFLPLNWNVIEVLSFFLRASMKEGQVKTKVGRRKDIIKIKISPFSLILLKIKYDI